LILTVWETRVNAKSIIRRHREVNIPAIPAFGKGSNDPDIAAVLKVWSVFIPDADGCRFT
jgi:hypothetical protein